MNNVTHAGKRVTKVDGDTQWNEGVYMNAFITQQPTFSVRIIQQQAPPIDICVGVAVDSSRYTVQLNINGWCYYNYGRNYDHGSYTLTPLLPKVNDTVTVCVNLQSRTIEYKVQGNSTGPPRFMNISDSQFQLLRPIVELYYVGNSVEIYP